MLQGSVPERMTAVFLQHVLSLNDLSTKFSATAIDGKVLDKYCTALIVSAKPGLKRKSVAVFRSLEIVCACKAATVTPLLHVISCRRMLLNLMSGEVLHAAVGKAGSHRSIWCDITLSRSLI